MITTLEDFADLEGHPHHEVSEVHPECENYEDIQDLEDHQCLDDFQINEYIYCFDVSWISEDPQWFDFIPDLQDFEEIQDLPDSSHLEYVQRENLNDSEAYDLAKS